MPKFHLQARDIQGLMDAKDWVKSLRMGRAKTLKKKLEAAIANEEELKNICRHLYYLEDHLHLLLLHVNVTIEVEATK